MMLSSGTRGLAWGGQISFITQSLEVHSANICCDNPMDFVEWCWSFRNKAVHGEDRNIWGIQWRYNVWIFDDSFWYMIGWSPHWNLCCITIHPPMELWFNLMEIQRIGLWNFFMWITPSTEQVLDIHVLLTVTVKFAYTLLATKHTSLPTETEGLETKWLNLLKPYVEQITKAKIQGTLYSSQSVVDSK